jgi:hypothetical protein
MTTNNGKIVITPKQVDGALARALFPDAQAGKPVYSLADDAVFENVADYFGLPAEQGRALVNQTAARQIRTPGSARSPFAELVEERWFPDSTYESGPLGLATLVVLASAAELMRQDQDYAANNYYARLCGLLEVEEAGRKRLESGYRKAAGRLWGRLNRWLEYWEGARGVPTAYAVGSHVWIGYPLSQAVIRQADRDSIHQFFLAEALPAGHPMPASEMETLLDAWMNQQPPLFSTTMRSLWSNSNAKARISQSTATELESWDGSGELTVRVGKDRSSRLLLTCRLRRFPRRSVDLTLRISGQTESETLTAEAADGPVELQFVRDTAGRLELSGSADIDTHSVLINALTLQGASGTFIRRPRRVVPLSFDELTMAYVETETVQLGERSLVLCVEGLVRETEKLLSEVARPGWAKLAPDEVGLPAGWFAFIDVQVFRRGDVKGLDLNPLLPRAQISVSLIGGLPLPGLLRKWSSLAPPEIHVVALSSESIRMEVYDANADSIAIVDRETVGGAAILDLGEFDLSDGEYQVFVYLDGTKSASSHNLVRLRSAVSPETHRSRRHLVHSPELGPLWPLIAMAPTGAGCVDGAIVTLHSPVRSDTNYDPPSFRPTANHERRSLERQRSIGVAPTADSCIHTGRHHIDIPTDYGGRPTVATVSGVCRDCGLVKRYPTSHGRAAAKKKWRAKNRSTDSVAVGELPPVVSESGTSTKAQACFDAICHVGVGGSNELGRILGESEDSALARYDYLRRLHAVGHVDIQRDTSSLDIVQWEVTPSTLLHVDDELYVLIGSRTQPEVAELREAAAVLDGRVTIDLDQGVPRVELQVADVQGVLRRLKELWPDLRVSDSEAPLRLAAALPDLSEVISELPMISPGEHHGLEQWSTPERRWLPVARIHGLGAFRSGKYQRRYFIRDNECRGTGKLRIATVELAKYAAAVQLGESLHGYHSESQSLLVPLGAELPGLYSRAACLGSGRLPVRLESTPAVRYLSVGAEVAAVISERLGK